MANDKDDGASELTPLQKYLAKQKADGVSSAPEPRGSSLPPRAEELAPPSQSSQPSPPTDSAPFWSRKADPQSAKPSADSSAGGVGVGIGVGGGVGAGAASSVFSETGLTKPAPFLPRGFAYFVDFFIVSKIVSVLTFTSGSAFYLGSDYSDWFTSPVHFLVWQAVIFVYFGWFYHEKGATPGKLMMGLQVSTDSSLGGDQRLSYVRTYFRETIGKFLSGALLLLGYLLALFRDDHRALHDLLFETRVVKKIKSSST